MKPSKQKAKKILKDGKVRGKDLTDKQKRFFAAIAYSEKGNLIKVDPYGQWSNPGEPVIIPSNSITMDGVNYPVLGISDKGDIKLMKPNKKYKFKGSNVLELPVYQSGGIESMNDDYVEYPGLRGEPLQRGPKDPKYFSSYSDYYNYYKPIAIKQLTPIQREYYDKYIVRKELDGDKPPKITDEETFFAVAKPFPPFLQKQTPDLLGVYPQVYRISVDSTVGKSKSKNKPVGNWQKGYDYKRGLPNKASVTKPPKSYIFERLLQNALPFYQEGGIVESEDYVPYRSVIGKPLERATIKFKNREERKKYYKDLYNKLLEQDTYLKDFHDRVKKGELPNLKDLSDDELQAIIAPEPEELPSDYIEFEEKVKPLDVVPPLIPKSTPKNLNLPDLQINYNKKDKPITRPLYNMELFKKQSNYSGGKPNFKFKKEKGGLIPVAQEGLYQQTFGNYPLGLLGNAGNFISNYTNQSSPSDSGLEKALFTGVPILEGIGLLIQHGKRKKKAKQDLKLSELTLQASSLKPDNFTRQYVRPEDYDLMEYNPYGTGTEFLAEKGAKIPKYQLGANLNMMAANVAGGFGNLLSGGGGQPGGFSKIGSALTVANPALGIAASTIGGIVDGIMEKKIEKMNRKTQNNLSQAAFMQSRNLYSPYMEKGGKVAMDGDLVVYDGGSVEELEKYPFTNETIEFKGKSHKDGGILAAYNDSPMEVEGGEPAVKLPNEDLVIFGNMKLPKGTDKILGDKRAKNKTFKGYVKELNKEKEKYFKELDKAQILLSGTDVKDSYDKLSVNTAKLIMDAYKDKMEKIAQKERILAGLQEQMLNSTNSIKAQKGRIIKRSDLDNYLNQGYVRDDTYKGSGERYVKVGSPEIYIPGEHYLSVDYKIKPDKDQRKSSVSVEDILKNRPKYKTFYQNMEGASEDEIRKGAEMLVAGIMPKYTKSDDVYSEGTPDEYAIVEDDVVEIVPSTEPEGNIPGRRDDKKAKGKSKLSKNDLLLAMSSLYPYFRPYSNLPRPDLTPEMFSMVTNVLEPVPAQFYRPVLEQYTDISLQDRLNANESTFREMVRRVGNNPEALSSLAAQKYLADANVLGEQMRLNLASMMSTLNKNRDTLNQAQQVNLGIADKQFERQAMARSNTKETTRRALESMANKLEKYGVENAAYKLAQSNFGYLPLFDGRLININPPAFFDYSGAGDDIADNTTTVTTDEVSTRRNAFGFPKGSTQRNRKTVVKRNNAKTNR